MPDYLVTVKRIMITSGKIEVGADDDTESMAYAIKTYLETVDNGLTIHYIGISEERGHMVATIVHART